jgi:hypothetical protein
MLHFLRTGIAVVAVLGLARCLDPLAPEEAMGTARGALGHAPIACQALPYYSDGVRLATGGWGINNSGQVIVEVDFSPLLVPPLSLYSLADRTFRSLPDSPALSGLFGLGPLGNNDSGAVVGGAYKCDPDDPNCTEPEQGFLFVPDDEGGSYTFFQVGDNIDTEARGIGDNGEITILAGQPGSSDSAYVYNPGNPNSPYPIGFTRLPLVRNGVAAGLVIPGKMNRAGQFVGSANFPGQGRWAFLYDPIVGDFTLFRYHDDKGQSWPTSARGINNKGQIVGWVRNPYNGKTFAFLLTEGRFQLLEDCGVGDTTGQLVLQAINDEGIMVGAFYGQGGPSTQYALIAWSSALPIQAAVPGVAAAPVRSVVGRRPAQR